MNFKEIHIGSMIHHQVAECSMGISRINNFFKCTEKEINEMYNSESLDTEILLKWSKLLKYDFFRIYTQHLILYAPQGNTGYNYTSNDKKSGLPQFKKNIYTKEVINFILEQIEKNGKTPAQIIMEYKIPKTTLYKWIKKYQT